MVDEAPVQVPSVPEFLTLVAETGHGESTKQAQRTIDAAEQHGPSSPPLPATDAPLETHTRLDAAPPTCVKGRHVEDMEQRRRSSTLRVETTPLSSSSLKRQTGSIRSCGVTRLMRSCSSKASSCASGKSSNNHLTADSQETADSIQEEREEEAEQEAEAQTELSSPDADDNECSCNSSTATEDLCVKCVLKHQQINCPWDQVVLKMNGYMEDDLVTSFCFDRQGGGIGRHEANVASIPADKILADKDHATIRFIDGHFYLINGDNESGTFVRVVSSYCRVDDRDEYELDRFQWPLDKDCCFRAGKSDFLVAQVDDVTQTLELVAIGGKLDGNTYTIDTQGGGIGRSAENLIHAGDGELSRKHAQIFFDESTSHFYLEDLNSTNGTFMRLTGPYHEPFRLEIGDSLLISQTSFTVHRFEFGSFGHVGARKHMEDSHAILQDMQVQQLEQVGLAPQAFFGVYDGHGGMQASRYIGENLHFRIASKLEGVESTTYSAKKEASKDQLQDLIKEQLTVAFEEMDKEFIRTSKYHQAGSTATTAFIAGRSLFVSNVGDSRTVLSRKGQAVRLSNDHKPTRSDEAQRIRDTGGFVIHGRIMGELAVSRAFGDSPFKTFEPAQPPPPPIDSKPRSEYSSHPLPINPNELLKGPLVVATPEITVTQVQDEEEFILLASDGLFDVIQDQEAIDFLHTKMRELKDVQRSVEALVEYAVVEQRSTDNVTAIVVMFQPLSKVCQ